MSRRVSVCIGTLALVVAGLAPASAQDGIRRLELMSSLVGGSHLGVVIDDVAADRAAELKLRDVRGALVREVEEDSPAAAAGIQPGDVILRFDGESVRSVAQLTRLVRETPAERTLPLEIWRDGASKTLETTLVRRDHLAAAADVMRRRMPHAQFFGAPQSFDEEGGSFEWRSEDGDAPFVMRHFRRGPLKLGISYQPLTEQLAEHFGVEGGVLVSEVHEDSPAAKAGLRAGDVIVSFGGKPVDGRRKLSRAVRDASPGTEVAISVQREGKQRELRLTVGGGPEPPEDAEIERRIEIEHEIET